MQQFLLNRQSYLIAAQQHQTTIMQQQSLFQQRLALFARESTDSQDNGRRAPLSGNEKMLRDRFGPRFKPPVLVQSSALANGSLPNHSHPESPSRRDESESPTTGGRGPFHPLTAYSGKTRAGHASPSASFSSSSAAMSFSRKGIQDLARKVHPQLRLDPQAEEALLKIADNFADTLGRVSCAFSAHRVGGKRRLLAATGAGRSTALSRAKKLRESPAETATPDFPAATGDVDATKAVPLTVTMEDVQLGLDSMQSRQPAGGVSIECVRPSRKAIGGALVAVSGSAASTGNAGGAASGPITGASSQTLPAIGHQHRLLIIRKHAALFNSHQGFSAPE